VGVKGGAFAGFGYERSEALMFSSDFTDVYSMGVDTMKFGGGAGLGGAAVLVVASGLPTLKDLKYCRVTGRDWGLSIGVRFKALAQTAAGLSGIKKLIHGVKYGEIAAKALSEGAASLKYVSGLMSSCELGTCRRSPLSNFRLPDWASKSAFIAPVVRFLFGRSVNRTRRFCKTSRIRYC
jgi:hypothetical protein